MIGHNSFYSSSLARAKKIRAGEECFVLFSAAVASWLWTHTPPAVGSLTLSKILFCCLFLIII